MKYLFILLLLVLTLPTAAQRDDRAAARAEVENHRKETLRAAERFLDRQADPQARVRAIAPYAYVYDEKQIAAFKATVQSTEEDPLVRAVALNRIYAPVAQDNKMVVYVRGLLADPKTPEPLRAETRSLVGSLSLTSLPGILEEYYPLVDDKEEAYREFAVSKLMMYGDDRIQRRLIEEIEQGRPTLFSLPKTIQLLSWAPKPDYYPAIFKVARENGEEAARLSAIQLLGPYRPAWETLQKISLDDGESLALREAALLALHNGDRNNTVGYARAILADSKSPDRLRGIAIQMALNVRQAMAVRRGGSLSDAGSRRKQKSKSGVRPADDFDRMVRAIYRSASEGRSTELANIAQRYLLLVRPPFKS